VSEPQSVQAAPPSPRLPVASGRRLTLIGELQSVDGYMNIALEKTDEYVNGTKRRTYGDAFVRGNNGRYCPLSHTLTQCSSCAIVMYISADS